MRLLIALALLFALGGASPAAAAHPYVTPACKGLALVPGYEKCAP